MLLKQYINESLFCNIERSSRLLKGQLIKTYTFQLGTLGLCIIGMFTLLLCLQTPTVNYCLESTDNDTVFSSGVFENDVAALRCNTRKSKFSRTNNFSTAANSAEDQADNNLSCFKLISNVYKSQTFPLQLNPNCDIIIHTTPTRAGPSFFIA